MNIYSFPTFNLTKILLTAEELGLDYNLHLLDLAQQEHKTPEHIERHPLGKVPAIEYQGEHYFESNSICRLLAEENNNRLFADNAKQRALINQWIDFMSFHAGRQMTVYFYEELIKAQLLKQAIDPTQIDEAATFLKQQLPVLEQALTEHAYLAGDSLSIADLIAFCYFQVAEYTSFNFDGYEKISAWYNAIKARPSYKKAMSLMPRGESVPFEHN